MSESHDLSRVLMAMANILGMWQGEMRIPEPHRELLIKRADGNQWELDSRGYPIPSDVFAAECDLLLRRELDKRYKS